MQAPQGYYPSGASTSTSSHVRPIAFPAAQPEEPVHLTPDLLEQSLVPLVAAQLEEAGFTHAERAAVHWIEDTAIRLVQDLFEQARERAEGQGRSRANVIDLWDVIEEDGGLKGGVSALGELVKSRRGKPPLGVKLVPQDNLPPEPGLEFLPDDFDDMQRDSPPVPSRLKYAPLHLPDLPPRHTYLRTRDVPTRQPTTLASLDKQVTESRLAEDSLRKLVQALEEEGEEPLLENGNSQGGTPAEGSMPPPSWLPPMSLSDLGPVVNWERSRMRGGRRWYVRRR